jgi:glucose-6-phosphate isomerase
VVNIGIGGSDLGPRLCYEAFSGGKLSDIHCHFISDADTFSCQQCLNQLNPETTLFLVSSKSFTTEETLLNAQLALEWMNHPQAMQQFIAITAHPEYAKQKGFVHILDIWDWVIGRYSCCSAINFINTVQFGYDVYESFLQGAHDMDQHFLSQDGLNNLPILLALIGIWNINFLNIPSHLLLIYHSKLRLLVDYIQQLDMESNGKSVNQQGTVIDYATGPIIWGGLGNQAQHSYYQHLAQSHQQVAIDFINVNSENQVLNQLCVARKKVLHQGIRSPLGQKHSIKQQWSINHIQLHDITPETLGALIALYEHKIFTQAWLWNINPFDQPGVEAAKKEMMHNPELKDYLS